MCGIVAYLGKRAAQPVLIEGLKRLEYRGYDSSGLPLLGSGASQKLEVGILFLCPCLLPRPKDIYLHQDHIFSPHLF